MSYCRWSSMKWSCDVYVYADTSGGWTTNVAANRRVGLDTLPVDPSFREIETLGSEEWQRRYRAHRDALDALPLEPIGLEHDGEFFSDSTPDDCADRLHDLRRLGYKVPQYAIDALRQEAGESE